MAPTFCRVDVFLEPRGAEPFATAARQSQKNDNYAVHCCNSTTTRSHSEPSLEQHCYSGLVFVSLFFSSLTDRMAKITLVHNTYMLHTAEGVGSLARAPIQLFRCKTELWLKRLGDISAPWRERMVTERDIRERARRCLSLCSNVRLVRAFNREIDAGRSPTKRNQIVPPKALLIIRRGHTQIHCSIIKHFGRYSAVTII